MTVPEPTPAPDTTDAGLAVVEPPPDPAASGGVDTGEAAAAPDGDLRTDGETGSEPDGEPDVQPGSAPDVQPVTATPAPSTVDFRMALVSSVTLDLPSQHPSVVLRETDMPGRQLTFSIGMPDAIALSHAHRRIATPRPLTHELMSDVLQRFDIDVVAVRIVGRQGGLYFAELDLRGRTGRSVLSCRPSDALTVALHQPIPVPILIDARLLESAGDVAPPGAGD